MAGHQDEASPDSRPLGVRREAAGSGEAGFRMSASARGLGYLCGSALVLVIAFAAGMRHYTKTQCQGPDSGGDCDLAGLEGMVWAAVALAVFVLLVGVVEAARLSARRKDRSRAAHLSG